MAHVYDMQAIGKYGTGGVCSTLKERDHKDSTDLVENDSRVRRLTPLECLRLQGLPDWWCDGVEGSDSAIYKMAGNGIAIPCAFDVLNKIVRFAQCS